MTNDVAQLLDGIPIALRDGTIVRCTAPVLRDARLLLADYHRVQMPELPETATAEERTRDEGEREAAMARLIDLFPRAVGRPELADSISSGDVLRLLPGFFWARTGARFQRPDPPPSPAPSAPPTPSTGTTSGAPGSPPSA